MGAAYAPRAIKMTFHTVWIRRALALVSTNDELTPETLLAPHAKRSHAGRPYYQVKKSTAEKLTPVLMTRNKQWIFNTLLSQDFEVRIDFQNIPTTYVFLWNRSWCTINALRCKYKFTLIFLMYFLLTSSLRPNLIANFTHINARFVACEIGKRMSRINWIARILVCVMCTKWQCFE